MLWNQIYSDGYSTDMSEAPFVKCLNSNYQEWDYTTNSTNIFQDRMLLNTSFFVDLHIHLVSFNDR